MRTINAPGIEWREIDKSDYSPAMVGTACWIPGFSDKGEPYKPMEFTNRTALVNYYGEPDNEAERYFYTACCEVLNQNGRLWTCRLPYDNEAFEKMVGFKYTVRTQQKVKDDYKVITDADSEIVDCATIETSARPITYSLDDIDEFRADENRVPAGSFLIVDTTGATYGKVTEDWRKGHEREVIGIVPVVTTAANAMYAQSLIQLSCYNQISSYEPLADTYLKSLYYETSDSKELSNAGLSATDLVRRLNTCGYYQFSKTKLSMVSCIKDGMEPSDYKSTYGEAKALVDANPEKYNAVSSEMIPEGYEVSAVKIHGKQSWLISVDVISETYEPLSAAVKARIQNEVTKINKKAAKFEYECEEDAINNGLGGTQEYLNNNSVAENGETFVLSTYVEPKKYDKWYSNPQIIGSNLTKDEANALSTSLIAQPEEYNSVLAYVTSQEIQRYCAVFAIQKKTEVAITESDPLYGWHNPDGDDSVPTTMALDAGNYFSTIQPAADGEGFDPEHLKDIGVVVYKMYLDPSEGNKVSWEPVEAYCGSLYKDDKDPNTGVSKFIDKIINSQSQYINFFSNCFTTKADKQWYLTSCDILISKPSIGGVLGLYEEMTKEDISISKSIYDGLNKGMDKIKDLNKLDIDIICDTGLANIASYLKAIYGDKGAYDLTVTDDLGNSLLGFWKATDSTNAAIKTWKTVEQKFDNFCKNVRKDCMFVADGLRPLVLQGDKKIIRDTKPKNTIDADILPYLKSITGLNTSYCGLYMDWFEMADDYSGDFFWCPPSIKAMGVMINTDVNYNYWDAPAGLNRGKIAAVDVAFSPTIQQAGAIYQKCINYAVDYPDDGIVLEGQRTTQVKPSAFDRINVRRLFCRLERMVYKVSRYFLYEGNTAYTRQRFVDAIDPYFKECKVGGGCYDYKIVCDESNNTAETIDRNELHCSIGIKPVKAIEFIMIDYVCTSTGASWEEVGL